MEIEKKTVKELRTLIKQNNWQKHVKGYSKMIKSDLIKEIKKLTKISKIVFTTDDGQYDTVSQFETEQEIISMIDYLKGIQEFDENKKLIRMCRDKFGENIVGFPFLISKFKLLEEEKNVDYRIFDDADDEDSIYKIGYVDFDVIRIRIDDNNDLVGLMTFFIEDEDIRNNLLSYLNGAEPIFK